MRGVGHPTVSVYIVLGTVLLNFLLDPLFIFGWGPVKGAGVTGAAIATLITQSIAALTGIFFLLRGKYTIHVKLKDFIPDYAYIKTAFFIGLPASVEQSMRALGIAAMTFLITAFGTLAVAAYGVVSNVLQVVTIPAMGLSMAISVLAGQNIGAGNTSRAAQTGVLGGWLGFGILTALGVIVYFFAPHVIAFFIPDDSRVIAEGTVFLRIMCLAWGFIGIQLCLTGIFRASGNLILSMVLTLVSQWVLQFPLAYILSHKTSLGINGLWWAFPVSNIVIAVITIAIFARGDWKKKKLTQEQKLEVTAADEIVKSKVLQH